MKVVASIEARMGASRLPGKMSLDIAGQPTLVRVIERLQQARSIDQVVVATTTSPSDDQLEIIAQRAGVAVYRGSENDVLQRVLDAHNEHHSDVIVEICGDCPLLDPDILDQAVEVFLANDVDVVATGVKQSYPQGTEVQIFRRQALAEIAATTNDPSHREHVSLYFYENPEKYNIFHLMAPQSLQAPEIRLQLDYPEDLELIRKIYHNLIPGFGQAFRISDILKLLNETPDLKRINAHCVEKSAR